MCDDGAVTGDTVSKDAQSILRFRHNAQRDPTADELPAISSTPAECEHTHRDTSPTLQPSLQPSLQSSTGFDDGTAAISSADTLSCKGKAPESHCANSAPSAAEDDGGTPLSDEPAVVDHSAAAPSETTAATGEHASSGSGSSGSGAPLPSASAGEPSSGAAKDTGSGFECNICLETAEDAVVSYCGHLYCWPCLHNWLEYQGQRATCPVCKSAIGRDKVVPLYGRGKTNQRDPREKPLPQRPAGQRSENEYASRGPQFQMPFMGAQFAPNVAGAQAQFSFGFGMFPSLFGLQFTTFPMTGVFPNQARNLTPVEAQQAMLSRLLLMLGSFIIMLLLLY